MPTKTAVQPDPASVLRNQIAEIEQTLTRFKNPAPTVNGSPVQYLGELPLYDRLKAEIADEGSRAEALQVQEKLEAELPKLRAELASLEKQATRQQYEAEYESLQPEIDSLIDQINLHGGELEGMLERLTALDNQAALAWAKANPGAYQMSWESRLGNFRRFLPRIERGSGRPGYCLLSRAQ